MHKLDKEEFSPLSFLKIVSFFEKLVSRKQKFQGQRVSIIAYDHAMVAFNSASACKTIGQLFHVRDLRKLLISNNCVLTVVA